MGHLWSGRFEDAPDRRVFDFQASFRFDRRLLPEDVQGSLAWASALAAAGAISAEEERAIRDGLEDIYARARRDAEFVQGDDEDVHAFVERQLIERIGEVGKRLHTGRSRNEQVSLDLRLYLLRRARVLQAGLIDVLSALADRAAAAGEALMPAYTHLRRAQPVLVAHFFLAHAAALRRAYVRFGQAYDEADALPLGSGAVAGTSYAVDTNALAARLGFSRVVSNSIDAAADRDFVSAFLYACATTIVPLSRLAEDLIVFGGEEFGFFDLADRVTTGSSLMPQKKNPDPLELVRGKTGRVIGRLTGWLTTLKGLPSGYNKDLQEDKEAIFDTDETTAGSLEAVATVVRTLTLNQEVATTAASGMLLATDAADYLVARGMPFRRAHEVVAKMVRTLLAEGRDFQALTLDEWRSFSELFDEDTPLKVSARAAVEARKTPQSTNPARVAAALVELRDWIAAEESRQRVEGSRLD